MPVVGDRVRQTEEWRLRNPRVLQEPPFARVGTEEVLKPRSREGNPNQAVFERNSGEATKEQLPNPSLRIWPNAPVHRVVCATSGGGAVTATKPPVWEGRMR